MYRIKLFQHGNEIRELLLESGREYTFGRGDDCDVQLDNHHGISRAHFKLLEEGGQWCVQVISKFGDIHYAGQPVQHLPLEAGAVFKLVDYDFHFLEIARAEIAATFSSSTLPATLNSHDHDAAMQMGSMAVGSDVPAPSFDFEGNDEATRIANAEAEAPFVRIVRPGGREETIALKGRRWISGREDGSDIPLHDRKASRRQFELNSTPQGYFIHDLGSSNGTLLNGVALPSDESRAIKSGDVIQVGKTVIHFEMRDSEFTKRLMVVAPHARVEQPILLESQYAMINYPVVSGPGGAVRVDQMNLGGQIAARLESLPIPFTEHLNEAKKKKVRFWILSAAVLVPLLLLMTFFGDSQPSQPTGKAGSAFSKLAPQQQKQVKELYVLAVNLYMQQKLALAASQLQNIHKILPEGYESSLSMAAECEKQADLERTLRELEDDRRRREEIRRTVEKTIRDCEPLSRRTSSMDEMNNCLRMAIELDPENSMVRELIHRVQQRLEQKRLSEIERRDFAARAAKGKALFQRAQALEMETEYLDALDAYRKHSESPYPDPEGLKGISQRRIISLSKKMGAHVDQALRAAEAAYAIGKYKEALDNINRAKKYDPKNVQAAELNAKYRREINTKMREIYEEAIISEGLGDVDSAKVKWKKIIDTDHPDGEYHRKAQNKLRMYGNF